jgi:hypothetical protein
MPLDSKEIYKQAYHEIIDLAVGTLVFNPN